ncbi:MAG: HEAT repeat domain-containing protein [Elusimicrobiota bacterium]
MPRSCSRWAAVPLILLAFCAPAGARERTKHLLSELAKTQGDDQLRVITALGRSGKGAAVGALLKVFDIRSDAPKRSAAVILALGRLEDEKAVEPLIAALDYLTTQGLQGELPPRLQALRNSAVEALGAIGGDRAKATLSGLLGDGDEAVVAAAVRGLGRSRDKRSLDQLIELAGRGGALAQAVFEALGRIADAKALPVLQRGLASEKPLERLPAAYALALMRRPGEEVLEAALEPGSDGDKPGILAAYYLTKLDRAAGLDHLIMLLQADGNPSQALAAESLGKAGNPKAALALTEQLGSEDPAVRLVAVRALGQLGGKRAVQALQRAKNDPDPGVRAAARFGLADCGELD